MNVVNYIIENWDFLLLIALAAGALIFAVFKGNKSVVMDMLVALVTAAEKEYGGGTGVLKLASVIDEIYPKLPTIIKTFITSKMLKKWVEDALKIAKKKWEANAAISGYIESGKSE